MQITIKSGSEISLTPINIVLHFEFVCIDPSVLFFAVTTLSEADGVVSKTDLNQCKAGYFFLASTQFSHN